MAVFYLAPPTAIVVLALIYLLRIAHLRTVQALQRDLQQARQLLAAAPTAILVADSEGVVREGNLAAHRLLGTDESSLVGRSLQSLVNESEATSQRGALLSAVGSTKRPCSVTVPMLGPAGDFPAQCRLNCIEVEGETWMILTVQDLSMHSLVKDELRKYVHQLLLAKEALQQQNADLEQIVQAQLADVQAAREVAEHANAAKSEFLSRMSHELRTPLHGILSFARFGTKRYAEAPREKLLMYFDRIDSSGRTLLSMLNELLDLAKLEAGAMTLECAPVDLSAISAEIMSEVAGIAMDKNLTLRTASSGAALVWGDPSKLAQVVRNLVGNSIKFAPSGGEVEVSIQPGDGTWVLQVRDDGPGIPDEECDAVFEKFVQSHRTRTNVGGTGLGLAICRELIALHQGRIWATPTHGQGALLQIELPRWEVIPSIEESSQSLSYDPIEIARLVEA